MNRTQVANLEEVHLGTSSRIGSNLNNMALDFELMP